MRAGRRRRALLAAHCGRRACVSVSASVSSQVGEHFLTGSLARYHTARARASGDVDGGEDTQVMVLSGGGGAIVIEDDARRRDHMLVVEEDELQGFVGRTNRSGIAAIGGVYRTILNQNVMANAFVRGGCCVYVCALDASRR